MEIDHDTEFFVSAANNLKSAIAEAMKNDESIELDESEDSDEQIFVTVYLKDGNTAEVDLEDLAEFMEQNSDNLEIRKVDVRRPPLDQ